MVMARRSDPNRAAFWQGLIERRRRSRLSVAQFCEQSGVSPASFYQWQRKLRAKASPANAAPDRRACRLVPVRIIADSPSGCSDSAGALEIDVPGGIRLRIPAGCDRATLQFVLGLLLENREAEGD